MSSPLLKNVFHVQSSESKHKAPFEVKGDSLFVLASPGGNEKKKWSLWEYGKTRFNEDYSPRVRVR